MSSKGFIKVFVLCMILSLPALITARNKPGIAAVCNYGFASRDSGETSVCQQVDGGSSSGKFFGFFCQPNSCGGDGDIVINMTGCQLQSEVSKNLPGTLQQCKAYGPAPRKINNRNAYSCTSIKNDMYYCPRDVGVSPYVSCTDCQPI
ncbi:uncharacterized protein MELLADRAFT_101444 [Melampsora larici-populina 98AG31]|uniref:Secreted protein n=1 Tax=Melampsora larici-populina (strain 98AG31 / pathotype 3-4-7) TaxID=747676 RepID=F4R4R9_MELLP|nr:uncharacterized protein MELLADRAFT_101444 [Melampsora larici-populina 98AG31]EGG12857.1 secreted protein [Melampsora larici-populina 98AG31]